MLPLPRRAHRAHPRPCGEHAVQTSTHTSDLGSSPPVRGARVDAETSPPLAGLIPARAGSTYSDIQQDPSLWAHPRPCGEHFSSFSIVSFVSGSSPPVRGAQITPGCQIPECGLIPARAGSTLMCDWKPGPRWAHPRPCGEHVEVPCETDDSWGSSPPVRGARIVSIEDYVFPGLIPARAGSTVHHEEIFENDRAHPRPCGEHNLRTPSRLFRSGSSPPVRGAHLLTWGFIPYTGKIGLLWSQSLRPEYTINNCS